MRALSFREEVEARDRIMVRKLDPRRLCVVCLDDAHHALRLAPAIDAPLCSLCLYTVVATIETTPGAL